MARLKISQLDETTNPNGTDVVPIVNGGTTKKVTLDTIRAGLTGVDSNVSGLSANWQNTYTTVLVNSATNWNNSLANQYTHDNFLPLSGGSLTGGLSTFGNFEAFNEGGSVILFVSGDKVGILTENPNQTLTVVGNISATGVISASSSNIKVNVIDSSTNRIFTDADNNKVVHVDTTTSSLCAIFPSTLPDGFNVAIMNTGTNNLRLSAAQLNSVGVTIGVRYGGAFVYKDNNQLFAVGRL